MRSTIFFGILFLAIILIGIPIRSAHSCGALFQTECGNYNGIDTLTFIYPMGEKSAVEDCVFVNPDESSQLQCNDGAELGHIPVCVSDPKKYEKLPKLYAVILGCNFDEDCQAMAQHRLIYRNFTNMTQPNTLTHDDDDVDFSHIHFPDLDAPKAPGISADTWAIQAVFPCDENGCGPQVRIEKIPTSIAEVREMIAEGKLYSFPFPIHYPALLPKDAQCPNMVLHIPIVKKPCDPATHHVY